MAAITTVTSFNIQLPSITALLQQSAGAGLQTVISNLSLAPSVALSLGSSAGQANIAVGNANLAVTSGTPFVLNLSGGGSDQFGNTFTMSKLVAALFVNFSTTSGQNFVIGAGTHSVFGSDQNTAEASGGYAIFYRPTTGYTVASSSTDNFTATLAAGTSVGCGYILFGR
jgi:hypothetical protein